MDGRPALIITLAIAIALAGGGLYFILQPGTQIFETNTDRQSVPPPPPLTTPPAAPATVPPAAVEPKSGSAIYRCQRGRSVVYSDSPCEGGKIVDIQPTRGYETARSAARPNRAPTPEAPAPASAASDEATRPAECKRLDELIAWIDSEARQGGNIQRMEELKERRRKAVDRQHELRC